ncbi:hypothetical protein [Desertibacillus haloalkaliphilus]|uniref:hypothetical protein n=1 Tax=Desertibacillus haloalkaliphilus TaxID=1328930 RepID=UPI0034D966B9
MTIDHELHYTMESRYDALLNHPVYLAYKNAYDNQNTQDGDKTKELFLKKSIWDFTSFGKLFGQCCL